MTAADAPPRRRTLWAVSDLHASVRGNAERIASLVPPNPRDWIIVAGDVAERIEDIIATLRTIKSHYEGVIWVPGNHELFCRSQDEFTGLAKYEELVWRCRDIGVFTPEDPYPRFGDMTIVGLFTLYDYSFRTAGYTVEQAIQAAHDREIVMTDEFSIAPFVNIRAWCWDRLAYSVKRLSRVEGKTILVNHWPLVVEPVRKLAWQELQLWCGSRHTRNWAHRYDAQAVIFGHLHIPGTTYVDSIPHIEVSLGYPREWSNYGSDYVWPYPVMEVVDDAGA
ncbi:MAG: metallophosphoesterase [Corynebacterium sp.]|nr:metallophosphoesterase [Corynebacterium sp.]